jgi:hypothetical protein
MQVGRQSELLGAETVSARRLAQQMILRSRWRVREGVFEMHLRECKSEHECGKMGQMVEW